MRTKSAAGEVQIGERKQRKHLRAILGDAAIAHLGLVELATHDTEHVIHFGAHFAEGRSQVTPKPPHPRPRFAAGRSSRSAFLLRPPSEGRPILGGLRLPATSWHHVCAELQGGAAVDHLRAAESVALSRPCPAPCSSAQRRSWGLRCAAPTQQV